MICSWCIFAPKLELCSEQFVEIWGNLNRWLSMAFVAVVVVGMRPSVGFVVVLTVGPTYLRGRTHKTIRNRVLDQQTATRSTNW